MTWDLKSKESEGSSTLRTKIEQSGEDEEIHTPDGHQILVGADEDKVLLYQEAFINWDLKSKEEAGSFTLKTKIEP
jgi:hypothetical protein